DKEFIEKLEKLKSLLSHKNPNMQLQEVLNAAMDSLVKKLDPTQFVQTKHRPCSIKKPELKSYPKEKSELMLKATGSAQSKAQPAPNPHSPPAPAVKNKVNQRAYISKSSKQHIWKQANGRCQYKFPISGHPCNS